MSRVLKTDKRDDVVLNADEMKIMLIYQSTSPFITEIGEGVTSSLSFTIFYLTGPIKLSDA